jgi:hypothetical protein
MSETASKSAPPYVPHATAASLRMVGSVMGRLAGVGSDERAGGPGRPWQLAGRVVAGYLDEGGAPTGDKSERRGPGPRVLAIPPGGPVNRASRMWDDALAAPSQRRRTEERPAAPRTVVEGFEPSDVVRSGLSAAAGAEAGGPLWSLLTPAKLEPVVEALERSLATPQPTESRGPVTPTMTLLQGGGTPSAGSSGRAAEESSRRSDGRGDGRSGGDERRPLPRAALDASAKLLEALRAHAAAQAAAGDNRVSLGDMTLIAHADKNQQLAAAQANSVPHPKEADKALGHMPNPKVMSNQYSIMHKIREIANAIMKDDDEDNDTADSRFGDA